jgi:hypothetical protein
VPRRLHPPRSLLERCLIITVLVCVSAILLMAMLALSNTIATPPPASVDVEIE